MPQGKKHLAAPGFIAALVLGACAANPEVGCDYNHQVNFASYHSFAVMPRNHGVISLDPLHNPLVTSRAEDDIEQELQRKGYTLTDPLHADFIVDFTIGAQERIELSNRAVGGAPGLGSAFWQNNIDVHEYNEGVLGIDIFDGPSRQPVWHGGTRKELSQQELDHSADPTRNAVASLLTKFPPAW